MNTQTVAASHAIPLLLRPPVRHFQLPVPPVSHYPSHLHLHLRACPSTIPTGQEQDGVCIGTTIRLFLDRTVDLWFFIPANNCADSSDSFGRPHG